jgi:hypothetical protein
MLYQVGLSFCTVGIDVDKDGTITEAAPILKGWKGKKLSDLVLFYHKREQFESLLAVKRALQRVLAHTD